MDWMRNPGRVAGLIYLLLGIMGPFRLMYIPNTLLANKDPAATASNIASHETLFRLGIVSEVLCGVTVLFVTLALYRLLKSVNQHWAVVMVIVGGVMPATIDFLLGVNDAAALILVRGADFLAAFTEPQRHALAMLFLRLHHHQIVAAELLWGLWLFPLGALVYRSRFLPRFLGVWLIVNGLAYVILSFTGFLWPQYEAKAGAIALPALLGEVALILWLVIRGARPQAADQPLSTPAAA